MIISRGQSFILVLIPLFLSACSGQKEKRPPQPRQVSVFTIQTKTVTITHNYIGRVRAHHHINVRAPEAGLLNAIQIKEGQAVSKGDPLFEIASAEKFSPQETTAHMTMLRAPFDGVVGPLLRSQGSLLEKGDSLTTLSDSAEVWVYFHLPEARYLDFKTSDFDEHQNDLKIIFVLPNGTRYDHPGKLGSIGGEFNPETGSIAFRADFPNPEHKLRHGQSGTLLISFDQKDAIVIPQRTTFEEGGRQFVYVIDQEDVAHQREIELQHEFEGEFVIKSGLQVNEKIVNDGVKRVNDGQRVYYAGSRGKKSS